LRLEIGHNYSTLAKGEERRREKGDAPAGPEIKFTFTTSDGPKVEKMRLSSLLPPPLLSAGAELIAGAGSRLLFHWPARSLAGIELQKSLLTVGADAAGRPRERG